MAKELAFALINPYTIAKSRTGGVIGRFISRTDLDLVAARMFGPSQELAEEYAALIRAADPENSGTCDLIADYVLQSYAPDPETGCRRRVMMLLFAGEDAVEKVWRVTGSATLRWGSGESIRDTYGDYVVDGAGAVRYFEPAVLVGPCRARAISSMRLWARYAAQDGGIISDAVDLPAQDVQQTLVLLKPDNFRFHSTRPGSIIDILSRSGLRIVGAKKFCMTVAQAEDFYGPVREALRERLKDRVASRAAERLSAEFAVQIPDDVRDLLGEKIGPIFADKEFERIIEFMTGFRPSSCDDAEKGSCCREECLALVYAGHEAVSVIRSLLGPTDPAKAAPGSVRREYGHDILVNAAHASDAPDSARREMAIVNVEEDTIGALVSEYYGTE